MINTYVHEYAISYINTQDWNQERRKGEQGIIKIKILGKKVVWVAFKIKYAPFKNNLFWNFLKITFLNAIMGANF